jgi:Protein of unknown function (DUF2950)
MFTEQTSERLLAAGANEPSHGIHRRDDRWGAIALGLAAALVSSAVASASAGHKIVQEGENRAVLEIGSEQWPFPIPIVREANGWRFDTAAGEQEILGRRIDRNELNAIEVRRELKM